MVEMEHHNRVVAGIASRVRRFYQDKRPFRIYHGSTCSTRDFQRRPENTVDTSALNHVLHVDGVKKTALAEANVSMDALVAATLPQGLVPLVVMEFPGITVGGGFSGTSGESSSFRYGAFDTTVNWIEIVLATGEVTTASRTTDSDDNDNDKTDLFWGAASACGTMGVVTLLEVQLRDAKEYVQLTYSLHTDVLDACKEMRKETGKKSIDYVDAITFSKDSTIICSGKLTNNLPEGATPVTLTRSYDPWFYIHTRRLQKRLRSANASSADIVDFIPLKDYLFRYDRGGFWVAMYSFHYFLVPFNRITRFVLDPFLHTHTMYRALHASGLSDVYMVQDVGIPQDRVADFVDWLDKDLAIYPLWLCPLRFARDTPNAAHGLHSDFAELDLDPSVSEPGYWLMNFGIWGPLPGAANITYDAFVKANRALENKVQELGGKKWLYAHTYYTEDEFWSHYDRKSYDQIRAKYGADWMPTVYDKVKAKRKPVETMGNTSSQRWMSWATNSFWGIWPMRGLYGVLVTILQSRHLSQRREQLANWIFPQGAVKQE